MRAARAAGIEVLFDRPVEHGALPIIRNSNGTNTYWEPLESRAQAFGLIVKLRLAVAIHVDKAYAGTIGLLETDNPHEVSFGEGEEEMALLRAITTAAAAIAE